MQLKAFEITWGGISGVFAAETAAKARALAARTINELWQTGFGRALRELRCRRAPYADRFAAARERAGSIPNYELPIMGRRS